MLNIGVFGGAEHQQGPRCGRRRMGKEFHGEFSLIKSNFRRLSGPMPGAAFMGQFHITFQ
jgi:hypothetical protein